MKKTLTAILAAAAALNAVADAPAYSDDEIKERLRMVVAPRCGHADEDRGRPPRKLTDASWFDGDTNRLMRLIRETAEEDYTQEGYLASGMIQMLGRYGSAGDLPFLYSCVTNPACGKDAVASILNIEGVTSNSVAAAASYHSISNCNDRTRTEVFEMLAVRSYAYDESTIERQLGVAYALNYAATTGKYTKWMDRVLQRCDPTYKNSKRRLSVLRAEYGLGLDHWEIGYVTNAINELVAYPEADLPE